MMRVLRTIASLDPRTGGPAVSCLTSATGASLAGVSTDIACVASTADAATVLAHARTHATPDVQIHILPAGPRLDAYGVSLSLARFLSRSAGDYDLIHLHGAWVWPTLLATALPLDKPLVLAPHESLSAHDLGTGRFRIVKHALGPWYHRRLSAVVFASRSERDSCILAPGGPARHVVPHALPVPDVRRHAPPSTQLMVGFIGRLAAKKRVDLLLQSLAKTHADVRLLVAGSGEQRDMLRTLAAELSVEHRVQWCGFLSGDAKQRFFERIHLLAMPSDYECFGMAAVEAMSHGIPTLLSPMVGIADDVAAAGAGWVIPQDPGAIAQFFDELASSHERLARAGSGARTLVEDAYSPRTHGVRLKEVYESLIP